MGSIATSKSMQGFIPASARKDCCRACKHVTRRAIIPGEPDMNYLSCTQGHFNVTAFSVCERYEGADHG